MSATASAVLAGRLLAARSGSNEALGLALDQCRPYLLQLARQSLGASLRSKGEASDLVQETYLEAQRRFPHFEGASGTQLRAWLRCLLLHQAAKLGRRYRRTQKRQLSREVPLNGDGTSGAGSGQVAAAVPTPSVQVMADEQTRRLQEAIGRLPDDYRQVIALRYQEGLSFDEVGLRLNRSANAARMLWVRAVDRLKLEMQGVEPAR
jgi:RNA polymerase sigma-70 factor (ECF subfamily)